MSHGRKQHKKSALPSKKMYAYVLPQDEIKLQEEADTLAFLDCALVFDMFPYCTLQEIVGCAMQRCEQEKKDSGYREICNDIQVFNHVLIESYTKTYIKIKETSPQAFELTKAQIAHARQDLDSHLLSPQDFWNTIHTLAKEVV